METKTEQQILQQPKELFMEQQLRNNMPEGYKAAKLIDLFSYMFRMGFENGINWQSAQSEQSEMVKKSGVINIVKEHLSYFNSTGPIGTQLTELLTKLKDL